MNDQLLRYLSALGQGGVDASNPLDALALSGRGDGPDQSAKPPVRLPRGAQRNVGQPDPEGWWRGFGCA